MSIAEYEVPRPGPIPPAPPVSREWAVQMGYSEAEYEQAAGWFQGLGNTLPHGSTNQPESRARGPLLERAANAAGERLADESEALLAPCLDAAERSIGTAAARIKELEAWPDREFRCEGRLCTVAEARQITDSLTRTIEQDICNRHFHHARIARWWKVLAVHLLFADLAAFVVILADMFNLDYTKPLATPLQTLTVYVVPALFVVVQWFAAEQAGKRLNEYREKSSHPLDDATPALRAAWFWGTFTAFIAIGYTALLIWRLLAMAREADLGAALQAIFILLGIAIGLGAPLTKVFVVVEDGSSVSRRRDRFAAALDKQRVQWVATVQETRDALTEATGLHDEYAGQLRPRVLRRAGEPLVEAENTLGLLGLMLGTGPATPRQRTVPAADGDLPLLRWELENAPQIDNTQLRQRDRTYVAQRANVLALHTRLGDHRSMRTTPARRLPPASAGSRAIEMYDR